MVLSANFEVIWRAAPRVVLTMVWGVVASLPFAPEIVLPTIDYYNEHYAFMISDYGFRYSFNPTYPESSQGWVSEGYYGLDHGPILAMIENALSELIWHLMRRCSYIVTGLHRAGFTGGGLNEMGPEQSQVKVPINSSDAKTLGTV